jgi:hypothetical protein
VSQSVAYDPRRPILNTPFSDITRGPSNAGPSMNVAGVGR